jgi:hypothetical protein
LQKDPEANNVVKKMCGKKWISLGKKSFIINGCFEAIEQRQFVLESGLPDFSLFNIPKRGQIYQTASKLHSKWP